MGKARYMGFMVSQSQYTASGRSRTQTSPSTNCKPQTVEHILRPRPTCAVQVGFDYARLANDAVVIERHIKRGGKLSDLSGIKFVKPEGLFSK